MSPSESIRCLKHDSITVGHLVLLYSIRHGICTSTLSLWTKAEAKQAQASLRILPEGPEAHRMERGMLMSG